MQITFKALALSSIAFCATAAFAANQARVEVPFGFTAQGKSYPAGLYEVGLDANQTFVTMASKTDVTKVLTWSVRPTDPAYAPAVVTFDQAAGSYALKTVQIGQRVTPNLDKHSQRGISATTSIGGQ